MRPLHLGRLRALRFMSVGTVCFAVQYGVLRLLESAGAARPLGNAVGFLVSAQVNFTLSSLFTWGDRQRATAALSLSRLLSFNAAALTGLAVSTAVFTLTYGFLGDLRASGLGVLMGSGCNFLLCEHLVFRRPRGRHRAPRVKPSSTPRLVKERP